MPAQHLIRVDPGENEPARLAQNDVSGPIFPGDVVEVVSPDRCEPMVTLRLEEMDDLADCGQVLM
jgi:hypothetical protein